MRAAVLAVLLLWTTAALPCRSGGPEYDRAAHKADRAEQRALVAELTIQADSIVIATAEHIDETPLGKTAHFRVKQVLKGTAKDGELLTYEIPPLGVIGCGAASMFKNAWALEHIDYILYAHGEQLLRTGEWHREWPEISVREEIRRIRKALKGLDV